MFADYLWINGRNNRMTWWLIAFCQILVFVFFYGPVYVQMAAGDVNNLSAALTEIGIAGGIANIIFAWIAFVSSIRRYHDRDKSGWWIMMACIPLVGGIWQFIELGFLAGTQGDNGYGPMPGSEKREADLNVETDGLRARTNGLAKVDDHYLAEYARKYSSNQAATAGAPAGRFASASSSTGTFGKRR